MCSLSNEITHPTVDVDAVRSKINDNSVRLIDVRREEDYNQGHIPNAVNLPLASLLSDDSPKELSNLPKIWELQMILKLLFMMIRLVL